MFTPPTPVNMVEFLKPANNSAKAEIVSLLETAIRMLKSDSALSANNVDRILWRLVDATGILSELAGEEAYGMPQVPTGRGYWIHKE